MGCSFPVAIAEKEVTGYTTSKEYQIMMMLVFHHLCKTVIRQYAVISFHLWNSMVWRRLFCDVRCRFVLDLALQVFFSKDVISI